MGETRLLREASRRITVHVHPANITTLKNRGGDIPTFVFAQIGQTAQVRLLQ